jgi:hypothetical protein
MDKLEGNEFLRSKVEKLLVTLNGQDAAGLIRLFSLELPTIDLKFIRLIRASVLTATPLA